MNIREFIKNKTGHGKTVVRPLGALLITLAAALSVWLFVAANFRKEATENISGNLLTINSYKIAQITDWVGRHQREAARLSRHPFLGEIVSEEIARPGSRRAQLTAWLSDHAEQKRYISMAFLSPKGEVITATPGYISETGSRFRDIFARSSRTGIPLLTDLYLGTGGQPRMAMLSPISSGGRGGGTLCVLVIKIDPEVEFYPSVKASPLLFTKAETLLVRKEGDKALFLNELDYAKGSALKLRLPLSAPLLPAAAALTGKEGFFAGTDYRGEKVFSAIGHIEGSPWAVITKIDRGDILGPVKVKEYLALTLILTGALLLYGFFYALLLAREKAGRELLRENERRLAALFSNLPGLVYRCANDRDWTMEFLSPGCLDLTGYATGELLGGKALSFNQLIIPEDRERVWAEIQAALALSGKYLVTYSIKRKDGGIRTLWDQGQAIKGPDGNIEALEGYIRDITDQKKTEEALHVSEQIFREFMEHSPIYVFFKDEKIRPLHLSRNYEKMIGRPLPELLGKSMDELFPSDLAKKMVADDLSILKEGKEVVTEEELNGRVYRTMKFPITLQGKPRYLAGYTIDITEERRAEEKVTRLNELLVKISEQVPGVVYQYLLRPDGSSCFPYASSGMNDIYEVTPEEVREDASPVFGRIHPDDLKSTSDAILESARNNSIFHWEFRVVLPRQGLRWRLCDARPERLPDGSTLWHGIITDITERKLAEDKLAESGRALREAQEMAHLGYWTWDVKTGAVEWSPEVYRIFGLDQKTFTPQINSIMDLSPWPEEHTRDQELIRKATEKREKGTYDQRFLLPDKSVGYYTSTFQGKYDEGGGLVAIVGTILDITGRKQTELKLKKLNQDLLDKKQEMENFLYITTHDLRSPLVNIQGFSRNLEGYIRELLAAVGQAPLPDESRATLAKLAGKSIPEALSFVQESSRKMDALISALLKVSRLGRVEMKPETLNMPALIEKISDSLRYQLEAAGGKLRIGALPPCKGDPGAVSQLFSNLLDNAIKYRRQDRALVITVAGELRGGMALYSVADNGPGIAEADLPKIWEIFYRPGKVSGTKGEGIGLPMVKRIAEKNGGTIRAESKEGEGAIFYVELPAGGEVINEER